MGASAECELDLALVAGDRLDSNLDRIAEPVAATRAAAHQRCPRRVQLEELARQPPRRQEALEDLAEAGEEARADQAGDLALPRLVPAALEQQVLEQPREADVVGEVLDLGGLALAGRRVRGELGEVVGRRVVALAELAQQRAVHDEVGVAADRRGEVAVRRAREARVAEVARVVAGLLERAQDERRERLAAAAGLRGVRRRRAPRSRPRAAPRPAGESGSGAGGVGTSRSASFASERSIDCGSGALVDAVERRPVAAGEERGDVLVRGDHQLLDQHVGVRLALEPRLGDAALLEAEHDLGRRDLERAAREAAAAQLGRDLVGQRELLEDLRRCLAPLRLPVGQPRVRADHRAVERSARLAAGSRP